MTDQQHPITPPPELAERLRSESPHGIRDAGAARERRLIAAAYRAGADQELDACCEWLEATSLKKLVNNKNLRWAAALQEARRPAPKPPEAIEVDGFTYRLIK